MSAKNIALATVATDDYLPGTQVMLASFLTHNPWFEGDIVIIHNELSGQTRAALAGMWADLTFHQLGEELAQRMDAVSSAAGWRGGKKMQFASIEALALQGYDRVIFCDSDLLFLGSIETLLESGSDLVACGDGAFLRGSHRRIEDFAEIPPPDQAAASSASVGHTFNTGMMVLRPDICSSENYHKALAMIIPERWASDATGHTDQWVLNVLLAGQQELAPIQYNYLLSHRELIEQNTGETAQEAIVLHFTGPAKPWWPIEKLAALGADQAYFEAYAKWRTAYSRLTNQNAK